MKRRSLRFLWLIMAALLSGSMIAQTTAYNLDQKVPVDDKVRIGKLDNGLTYYIRENEKPKNRAEFYLVVNAGAIQENDDQDGLAHFCEHMAFNGTKHFEKHDIINYLQSIGMKFGPEINAFTSHDVTNYMLQKVPTDEPANVDTALLILYDWASSLSFEEEEIDNERGVIHEEWRTRRGAMFRLQTETSKTLYKGSKYAERDVIGDIDIIDNFEYQTLIDFYNTWYRPDLQAIIAVGDFDMDEMEEKIKEQFSQIPKRENPKERKEYGVPDHEETYVDIASDPEAMYILVQLYYKHEPFEVENLEGYRQQLVFQLYNQMLNNRLQEKLQEEDPAFIYGYTAYTDLTRTKDAYMAFAVAKNDGIKRTLETLLTENERVKQHGFADSELERAKKDLLSSLEKSYNERDKKESDGYVWEYFGHFLEEEPIPGIEFDYAFAQDILPGIGLDELNTLAPKWVTDENRVVIITGPDKENVELPTEEDVLAIIESVDQKEVEAYLDEMTDAPLLAEMPQAGKIIEESTNEELGTENWVLSNGIQVTLKPTDFKDDEILMRAFSFGGASLYEPDMLPSAGFASSVINESGIADFDLIQLQKLLAGKNLRVSPYIGDVDEGFTGSSSVKDFETMLQLVYLYFTDPPENQKAFNAYLNRIRGFIENRQNDPAAAFQDTITLTMADYHPRVQPMSLEYLDKVDFEEINQIYGERFADPGSFHFYFVGNFDKESIKPLIETYLGGLPAVSKEESWIDNNVRPPDEVIEKTLVKNMEVPKATVYIAYTGEYDYNEFGNRLGLDALCDILDIRYTETIREEQGGTYGVSVYPRQTQYPYEHYQVAIRFDCDPENADKLSAIVYEEIDKLKNDGPTMKDLNSVKENKLKTHKENLEKNNYWISRIKNMDYNQDDIEHILKYEDYINKLNIKGLKKAAKKYFGDEHVEIILLPENTENNIKNPMLDK